MWNDAPIEVRVWVIDPLRPLHTPSVSERSWKSPFASKHGKDVRMASWERHHAIPDQILPLGMISGGLVHLPFLVAHMSVM